MRKTVLSVMAAALVLTAAAGAFAWGGGWGPCGGDGYGYGHGPMMGPGGPGYYGPGFFGDRDDRPGPGGDRFVKDVPEEIRSAMRDLHRADLQIRLSMTEEKVDVARVRSLFERQLKLQEQVARWRFEEMLKGATSPAKK